MQSYCTGGVLQLKKSYHVTCILLQWGRTALHVATYWGRAEPVALLTRLGADVNALDKVSMCVMK